MSQKRSATEDNLKKVSTIMVQKMNPIPTGKQKKYDPERARDSVDFSHYSKLSLNNIKTACESFYGEPTGSCDVLYSDRGPSCINDAQLAGKKVILIRFVPPKSADNSSVSTHNNEAFIPTNAHGNKENTALSTASSITGITSKHVKKRKTRSQFLSSSPKQETVCKLVLEYFEISQKIWFKKTRLNLIFKKRSLLKEDLETT